MTKAYITTYEVRGSVPVYGHIAHHSSSSSCATCKVVHGQCTCPEGCSTLTNVARATRSIADMLRYDGACVDNLEITTHDEPPRLRFRAMLRCGQEPELARWKSFGIYCKIIKRDQAFAKDVAAFIHENSEAARELLKGTMYGE